MREFKNRSNAVTLAIGDGNNDELMILEAAHARARTRMQARNAHNDARTQANVGIGIAGVEGSGAVNASDYAIAEFRHAPARPHASTGALGHRRTNAQ